MKVLLSILISVIGCFNLYSQTQDSLVRAVAIVDGLFFDDSIPTKSLMPGSSTVAVLKDPDGKMVIGVYLPQGYVMEKSVIEQAIPVDRVMYSDRLLRDYNEHKPDTVAVYEGIGANVGEPFIDFEYKDTDNQVWNNEKLKGKIYVINVWQSECGPCRREMPALSQWKNRFPDVVFLSASRHTKEVIQPIVEKHNFNWTHLQEASDIVALVRQQGFPLTVVVDKDGIVRFAKVGASEENQAAAVAVIEEISH